MGNSKEYKKAYNKQYEIDHKDSRKEYGKKYRVEHTEDIKKYRENNKEYHRQYYQDHKAENDLKKLNSPVKKTNLCACGCGELCVKKFVKGHTNRGRKFSKEHNARISTARKNKFLEQGYLNSQETRVLIGISNKGKPSAKRINLNRDVIVDLYCNKKMTLKQVAKEFNVGVMAVLGNMKRYNIKTRNPGESKLGIKYTEEHLKNHKIAMNKPETKETNRKAGIERMKNGDLRKRISIKLIGRSLTEEHKNNIKKSWQDPIKKSNMIAAQKEYSSKPENIEKNRQRQLIAQNKPEVREKWAITTAKHIADGTIKPKWAMNKPETHIYNYYLSKGYVVGIDIIKQYHIKGIRGLLDFYLPKENTIVLHDGTYYHCDPLKYKPCFYNTSTGRFAFETWNRDKEITTKLISMGYKVIRIPERDVYTNLEDYVVPTLNKIRISKKVPNTLF